MPRSDRPASPATIRRHAAVAFRNHVRQSISLGAYPMRSPAKGETPLSAEERRHGIEHGLIRPFLGERG